METKTAKETNKGLDTVRARAKRQSSVRLNKAESDECQIPRSSLQKIRTLKSLSREMELEMAECPVENMNVIASMWDWFQRSIGNR